MKIQVLLAAGIFAVALVSGCASSKIGPAKTTLVPMENVGPLTLVEERIEIKGGVTNITRIKREESPESGQYGLKLKELEGNENVSVARANRPQVVVTPNYEGGYYGVGYGNYQPNYGYGGGAYNGYRSGITSRGEGGYNYVFHSP